MKYELSFGLQNGNKPTKVLAGGSGRGGWGGVKG